MDCTTSVSGGLCASTAADPLTFTASITSGNMVIGAPTPPHGDFAGIQIAFVDDLSIAGTGSGGLCPGSSACTGLVGTPEPSTWGMMLIAFAGLGFAGYRRVRNSRTAPSAA